MHAFCLYNLLFFANFVTSRDYLLPAGAGSQVGGSRTGVRMENAGGSRGMPYLGYVLIDMG